MGRYVVGGWTEYLTEGSLNVGHPEDPDFGSVDAFDEWGDNSGLPEGAKAGVPGPTGKWFEVVAIGVTNGFITDQRIWYRAFFIFTSDQNAPGAVQIVGGKQLFWRGGETAEDYSWGEYTTDAVAAYGDPPTWLGIGVSGNLQAVSTIGKAILTDDLQWEDTDFPEGGGDPSSDVPEGVGVIRSGAQLFSVAKHEPWGWCLSQIRLYTKPANVWAPIQLVGWKERVRDMAEQQALVVTNEWGQSSTEESHFGVGQWRTDQWGWGPSVIRFHFAPNNQPKPAGGCFVATACYGDHNAPEVLLLRRYRDNTLMNTLPGQMFVTLYYVVSPILAALVERSGLLKRIVKKYFMDPIIAKLLRYNTDKRH